MHQAGIGARRLDSQRRRASSADYYAGMWSVTGPNEPRFSDAPCPLTTTLSYSTDCRNSVCPLGLVKSPGPGGCTVTEPVVWPFRTGKVPLPLTLACTVSLLPALGCWPPLLKHWYTTVAEAEHVMSAV